MGQRDSVIVYGPKVSHTTKEWLKIFKLVDEYSDENLDDVNLRTITINPTTGELYTPTAAFGARPEPTTENPKPRASLTPNSFTVLVVENSK